jgi:flagellar biosynthetic protein FlhB
MAEEDDDSKTEQPSGKKLGKAREEGDVVSSQEVRTASMLTAILVTVWLIAPPVMVRIKAVLAGILANADAIRVGSEKEMELVLGNLIAHIALLMVAPLAFLMAVGVASSVIQTGWLLVFTRIIPDLNRINPLNKMGRMFSLPTIVESLKNMGKLLIVAVAFYLVLRGRIAQLNLLVGFEVPTILAFLHDILLRLLFVIAGIELFLAAADYFFQRFNFMKKLRMTKQEVKDEHKQTEGDPMVKSRLRSLRLQRARQRMMAAVPKADVVVTNPTHFACALKYDAETMNAPMLVAKGQDLVAMRIRQVAEENDVPIVENPPLARALFASVEIDKEIPPDHYKAVAEVISYVFRLKGKFRR